MNNKIIILNKKINNNNNHIKVKKSLLSLSDIKKKVSYTFFNLSKKIYSKSFFSIKLLLSY